jgi:hypothetical protein
MRKTGLIESALFFALFVGATTFSFIVHFESRYLLPIKLFGSIWIMVVIASIINSYGDRSSKLMHLNKISANVS